ncbi:hypothetical protein SLS62_003898 [Diatrype stigma]|uniref:N-acetyltransferase domain-containing protein n=1 Tax=Diatrype stigma TaxID=117547 RepID=A0AAN9YTJ3_9PEZI
MASKHAWKVELIPWDHLSPEQALTEAVPGRKELLETHIKAYPQEAASIEDTAREVRLAPRQPTGKRFTPIGHVALDIHDPDEDEKLGLPREGVAWLHQLYVSYALQGKGYGAAAMSQVEALAVNKPLNAKLLALDTIAKESQMDPVARKDFQARGVAMPTVSLMKLSPAHEPED